MLEIKNTNKNYEQLCHIVNSIKSSSSIVVATHATPDPDAIGSSVGLVRAIRKLGIDCCAYLEEVPQRVRSLVFDTPIITELPTNQFDLLIITDTASKKRIGGNGDGLVSLCNHMINVDHHYSNELWADVNYIDADSAASSIIIWELIKLLSPQNSESNNFLADSVIANLLYAGLLDDTGSFRFSNSNPTSFLIGAELVQAGASPVMVANNLFYSTPFRALKLKAMALSTLRLEFDGKVSVIEVTRDMMQACGASPDDAEGLVDEARSIDGVLVAVFIREREDGWKVSLRAKTNDIDVSAIAQQFGGGGHKGAAGCTIEANKSTVTDKLLHTLSLVIKQFS